MLKTTIISFALAVLASVQGIASAEYFLEWTSAVIQCEKTAEAGDISCEIKTGVKQFTAFTVAGIWQSTRSFRIRPDQA